MKEKAVIFDIDGTLADTEHRSYLAQAKKWDEFFSRMTQDKPKYEVVEILNHYYWDTQVDYKILLVTGRGEEHREKTVNWLQEYGIMPKVECLYMRPVKDFRKDFIIKAEIYKNYIEPKYNVRAVFEDRTSVVNMWRELGLTCLQVAPGNF